MNDTDDLRRTMNADQLRANTADLAGMVATFYQGLVEGGVPPEAAFIVTGQWLDTYLERVYWPDGGRHG